MNTLLVATLLAFVAYASAIGYGGLGYGGGYGGGYGHGYGHGAVVAAPVAVGHKHVGHSVQYEQRGHGGVVGHVARPVGVAVGHGYGGYGHGGGLALGGYGGHGYHG